AIAPFRLGLTATPERSDGGEELMTGLLGPIVYRLEAQQLAGEFLADYDVVRLTVQLSDEDRERYDQERATFRRFISSQGIDFGSLQGWQMFVVQSARSEAGRRASQAYREVEPQGRGGRDKRGPVAKFAKRPRPGAFLVFPRRKRDVLSHLQTIPDPRHYARNADQRAQRLARGFQSG